jgi:protein phosphatase
MIRRAVAAAVVLLVLAVGAVVGRNVLMDSWYVGASGGQVAIYRGVPGSIAGMHVSRLDRRTDVRLSSLIEIEQERVREGKTAASLKEALDIVNNLQRAPAPALSPAPPAPGPGESGGGTGPAGSPSPGRSPQVPPS